MSTNKKYYYIKLKEDFFESNELILLQSMDDGYIYSDILLKMYLRSLSQNGRLMVNDVIPMNEQMLSVITRHSISEVHTALGIFKQLGLIEILDDGTIYMLEIQSLIGQSSTEADRIRQYRNKISNAKTIETKGGCTNVQQTYNKRTPEIEIEIKDRDRDILNCCSNRDSNNTKLDTMISNNTMVSKKSQEKEKKCKEECKVDTDFTQLDTLVETPLDTKVDSEVDTRVYTYLEKAFGRTIGSYEFEKIENWKWQYNDLTKFAIDYAVSRPAKNVNYVNTVLNDFKDKGIKTVEQAKKSMESYQKNKGKAQSDEEVNALFDDFLRGKN